MINTDDCWYWAMIKDKWGYGRIFHDGNQRLAYRVLYEALVGTIPTGYEIDHLCRNPPCVNPEHMEAVTPYVNNMRSNSACALNARKTHCKWGHPLSGENLYVTLDGNFRKCKACIRRRDKARNVKRKAERLLQRINHKNI